MVVFFEAEMLIDGYLQVKQITAEPLFPLKRVCLRPNVRKKRISADV
jgi:hypothetical protein